MSRLAGVLLLALALGGALVAAGCASKEPASPTRGAGTGAVSTGTVSSASASRSRPSSRPDERRDETDGTGRYSEPSGGTAGGPQRTPGPSARARVIEAGAAEDRRSGGSEARIEPDGAIFQPGVGVLPRYRLRTIESRDTGGVDDAVMQHVPGTKIELPPPERERPVEPAEGGAVPVPSPLLVPKEAK